MQAGGPAPIAADAPFGSFLGGDPPVLAGMACDKLRRGRVHKVWIRGGAFVLATRIGKVVPQTGPWRGCGRFNLCYPRYPRYPQAHAPI